MRRCEWVAASPDNRDRIAAAAAAAAAAVLCAPAAAALTQVWCKGA